jgi:hypothetical protein
MSYPQYGKRGALDGGYGGYKITKLSYESPEGMSSRLRFICAWGGAPHPQWRRDLGDIPSRSPQKLHSPPSATEADAHTFASLRSLQPRVLPFVLSRAAALDAISSGAAAATHY